MRSTIGLGLIGGALALRNEKIHYIAQQQQQQQVLLQDACPSNYILQNEECRPAAERALAQPTLAFESNATNVAPFTYSLEESRNRALQAKSFPWSFWPECFTVRNDSDPFCVFSNTDFASGRGISIVTTHAIAYAMLENDAFKNPDALEYSNNFENPPFYEQVFPGKGRGLVANKTLNRGDQIMSSTPILITDNLDELPESESLALWHRAVATLPAATREIFWGLAGRFPEGEADAHDDRITTNYFEIDVDGNSLSGLFPEIARINHDCRPNAAYFFDAATLTHRIHAIRHIYPGEEITITYINNEVARDTRIRRLSNGWGFKCSCSSCSAHPRLVAESDARLEQMDEVKKVLNDWSDTSSATPAHAELLVSLYKQERLHAGLSTAYQHAAEVHSSFGMKWEAVRYARLSLEWSMLDKGWGDRDVVAMTHMATEPESTWSWNRRLSLKTCGCGNSH